MVKKARSGKTAKPRPSAGELSGRTNLSIPEAMVLTGYGRDRISGHLDSGDWAWFWEGKRRRIVTASIHEYQARKSANPGPMPQ